MKYNSDLLKSCNVSTLLAIQINLGNETTAVTKHRQDKMWSDLRSSSMPEIRPK